MNELRIVFMGSPEFAVASLEALLQDGFKVVAVVTAPDRPAGRGRKVATTAVKEAALRHDLPVLQPENLKAPEFLESLRETGANLLVVVAFRMLPEQIWAFPEHGTINLHASLLPDYRGAAPINWALINGETQTGVTTFFIDAQIDTGNIIFQEATPIGAAETAGDLHDRLMEIGARLIVRTARALAAGPVATQSQKHLRPGKPAPKLYREDGRIHWDQPATVIHNRIRGLSPYPGAWTRLQSSGKTTDLKILRGEASGPQGIGLPGAGTPGTGKNGSCMPGTLVIKENRLWACTGDGAIEILRVQPEGKRQMAVSDWLNGQPLDDDAMFL